MVSGHELNAKESYNVFLAVLEVYGYSAIRHGNIVKIIPRSQAKYQAPYERSYMKIKGNSAVKAEVIHVRYVPAKDLVYALKPLVNIQSYIASYGPSNDVIIVDFDYNIQKLRRIITVIDRPLSANNFDMIKLKYADPSEMASALGPMLSSNSDKNNSGIKLAADLRTNSILVSGKAAQRLKVRAIIAKMDVPTKDLDDNTQVIYLKYIQAKDIAPILANIIADYKQQYAEKTGKKQGSAVSQVVSGLSQQIQSSTPPPSPPPSDNTQGGSGSSLLGLSSHAPGNSARDQYDRPRSGAVSTAVQWEESTNSVIIRAPKALMGSLKKVISKLDIRRKQVLVEVVIAEVDESRVRELGVEWNTNGKWRFGTRFPSDSLSGISGALAGKGVEDKVTPGTAGTGMTFGFYHNGNLRALVRALAKDSASNILATPDIVTLDNETATIKVGELVPFSTGESSDNLNDGGVPFTSFDREEVGLSLTIKPQITPSGAIILHVDHTLSAIIPDSTNPNQGGGNPTTSERVITTNVMVDNGTTLVLAGLIQNQWQEITNKVPLLGDIPVLGALFRSSQKTISKNKSHDIY